MTRFVLTIAAIVEFIFRGLPAFLACEAVANLFGLEYIEELALSLGEREIIQL